MSETTLYDTPEAYLPHRAPMCVLSRVVDVTETTVTCETDLTKEGVLAAHWRDDGTLPEAFYLEVMAQTIGVWSHVHVDKTTIPEGDREADVGLLLSVRSVKMHRLVSVGEPKLVCTMTKMMLDERLAAFDGNVTCAGEVVASGRLTVYQPLASEMPALLGN